MSQHPAKPIARRRGCATCCSFFVGALVVALAAVWVVLLLNNRPTGIAIPPPPSMPAVNARDDFLAAAGAVRAMQHFGPRNSISPPAGGFSLAALAASARDAQPVLAAVSRGLAKPFQYPPMRTAASPYWRDGAAYRSVARTVADAAEYYERAGQPDRAAAIRLDGAEMGVKVPRGGAIVPDLVGIACETICLHRLDTLVPRLSRRGLAATAARLDRISAERVSYSDVLTEEGWASTSVMEEALRGARSLKDRFEFARTYTDASPLGMSPPTVRRARDIAQLTLANKAAMLKANLAYLQEIAREARGPYTGKSRVPVPNNPLATALPLFAEARARHVTMEAVVALLKAQVALYRYRADHGGFPDSLAALAPAYLKAVPDDPFGGRAGVSLRYRRLPAGGFVLYSVGPDMRDDGGKPAPTPGQGPGDIVAGDMWPKRKGP